MVQVSSEEALELSDAVTGEHRLDCFRGEMRAWIERSCPRSMRTPMPFDEAPFGGFRAPPANPDVQVWMERAAERGLTAPGFPVDYGGGGLDDDEVQVFREELRVAGARLPLTGPGLDTLAPAILHYGTDDQRRRFLPPLLRGEARWAQAFSEPDTGSDLASLTARAVRDGDEYVVDGQKTWSSLANTADWLFCLVRTDPGASIKQRGITMLLIDMDSDGVDTRPIELINGTSEFCEVFLDGVRVPIANRLGDENEGWTVAKFALSQERQHFGEKNGFADVAPVGDLWRDLCERPAELQSRVVRCELDQLAADCLTQGAERILPEAIAQYANVAKYFIAEHTKRSYGVATTLQGLQGLGRAGGCHSDDDMAMTRDWLYSQSHTIAGGTSEIQLNIIAKRDLRLPVTPSGGASR